MTRTERLFKLMQALRIVPPPATAQALADRLDVTARTIYRERYDKPAHELFVAARAQASRRGLAEVAVRWPITESAENAWWTLGDLEMEQGHLADAARAWHRPCTARSPTSTPSDPHAALRPPPAPPPLRPHAPLAPRLPRPDLPRLTGGSSGAPRVRIA